MASVPCDPNLQICQLKSVLLTCTSTAASIDTVPLNPVPVMLARKTVGPLPLSLACTSSRRVCIR
jgi:hypothetical protein